MESLKKNGTIKGFITHQVTERTDQLRMVKSNLDVMSNEYSRNVCERSLALMKEITEFRLDRNVDKLRDMYDKLMNDVKKVDLAQNLIYTLK